jgi:hypothetical protein
LTITLQSTTLTRAGFGVLAILDYTTRFTDTRTKTYSSLAGMVEDNFATTDLAYVAAQKAFSQNPKPPSIKIFRRLRAPVQRNELTPATAISTTYSGKLAITGGSYQDWTFTSSATANSAEILTGITAAIAALSSYSGNIVASTASGIVRVVAATGGKHFSFDDLSATFSNFQDETPDVGAADDLAECEAEDDDYYGLVSTSKGAAELTDLASEIEARRRFFCAGTMDMDTYNTSTLTDFAGALKTASYMRTAAFVQKGKHMEQGDAGVMGRWLPFAPGSETMHLKTVAGVDADTYTATQFANLTSKNALFYKPLGGTNVLFWGKAASGEYMDVVRFIDWLYANIQEDVFALLQSNNKIAFTDIGVAQVQGAIQAVLARGVGVGGLAADPAPTVTVPAVADISTVDKAARTLTGVEFTATLAGAIHIVDITGTVSV